MKKILGILMATMLIFSTNAEDKKTSFDLTTSTDSFFGLNFLASGSVNVMENLDITMYGLWWTSEGLTNGAGEGTPWTEFGAGVTYKLTEGLSATALIGVLSGNLQSNTTAAVATVGESIVPNLTVNYTDDKLQAQLYVGFYKTLYTGANERGSVSDYFHYWVNIGYKVMPNFVVGTHYEVLDQSAAYATAGSDTKTSTPGLAYQWVGPYIEMVLPKNNASLRFAGGWELIENTRNAADHFYKMSFVLSF